MAVNTCRPCSDPCVRDSAANSELGFRDAIIKILCEMATNAIPDEANLVPISGTYNGTDQVILASPGVGFKYKIRFFIPSMEGSDTTFQIGSKVGASATAYKTPQYNYLSNAGLTTSDNALGYFRTDANGALVITSNNPVDLLGMAEIIPA